MFGITTSITPFAGEFQIGAFTCAPQNDRDDVIYLSDSRASVILVGLTMNRNAAVFALTASIFPDFSSNQYADAGRFPPGAICRLVLAHALTAFPANGRSGVALDANSLRH
jgi:hypothetical protein